MRQRDHYQASKVCAETEIKVRLLEKKFKSSINKSKSYYELRSQMNHFVEVLSFDDGLQVSLCKPQGKINRDTQKKNDIKSVRCGQPHCMVRGCRLVSFSLHYPGCLPYFFLVPFSLRPVLDLLQTMPHCFLVELSCGFPSSQASTTGMIHWKNTTVSVDAWDFHYIVYCCLCRSTCLFRFSLTKYL